MSTVDREEAVAHLRDSEFLIYPEKVPEQAATTPQRMVFRTFEVDLCLREHRVIFQFHTRFPTTVQFWENLFPAALEDLTPVHYSDHPIQHILAARSRIKGIDSWYLHVDHEVSPGREPEARALEFLQVLDASLPSPHPPDFTPASSTSRTG